jgi:hypothetical protein
MKHLSQVSTNGQNLGQALMGRVCSTFVTLAETARGVNKRWHGFAFTHHPSIIHKLTEEHLGC